MADCYILETATSSHPEAYAPDAASAALRLQQLQTDQPHRFAHAVVVTCDDYFAAREAAFLARPVEEIDEAAFIGMFEMMFPLDWHHEGRIERFCLAELITGRIAIQYARTDGRCFRKHVRIGDRSTYFAAGDVPDAQLGLAA